MILKFNFFYINFLLFFFIQLSSFGKNNDNKFANNKMAYIKSFNADVLDKIGALSSDNKANKGGFGNNKEKDVVYFIDNQIPRHEGSIEDWNILNIVNDDDEKICYVVNYSHEDFGNLKSSRSPYISVTFKPPGYHFFHVYPDANFKENSKVSVSLNGKIFKMVGSGDYAFFKNPQENNDFIFQMSNASEIMVYGVLLNGKYINDIYNIKGFPVAYIRSSSQCTKT